MKKVILGLVLSLIISTSYAHHLNVLGWCSLNGGKAVFSTNSFANNLQVQVRIYGTTIVTNDFTTPLHGTTTVLFTVPQLVQNTIVRVQFRYRIIGSGNNGWSDWGDGENDSNSYVQSTNSLYTGCSSLPVKFNSIKVTLIKE